MSQISVDVFLNAIKTISNEKPTYKIGHDGSDGSCDGIGFIRGALLRSGVRKIQHMKESNQCARKLMLYLEKIDKNNLVRGDIVLKTCGIDDFFSPLPNKYMECGNEFTGDLTNYTDIGVVTKVNPVEILYMTKKGVKKDKRVDKWDYVGWLPFIVENRRKKPMLNAIVVSNGNPVKIYSIPLFSCKEFVYADDGANIGVIEIKDQWAHVIFNGNEGYMLVRFLKEIHVKEEDNPIRFGKEEIAKLRDAYRVIGDFLNFIEDTQQKKKTHRWNFFRFR